MLFGVYNREKIGSSSGGAVAVCLGSGADGTGFESSLSSTFVLFSI